MTTTDHYGQLHEHLEAVETAYQTWIERSNAVIRSGVHDPELDALRADLDAETCELVTAWEVLGAPADIEERLKALPGFDRWRTKAREDEETSAEFAALIESETVPEWDDEPPDELPLPAGINDAEMADAFGRSIEGRFLHCKELGGWLEWDGHRWERNTTEAIYEEARRYVLDLCEHMLRTATGTDDLRQALRYRSKARIEAVVVLARRLPGIAATADEFDQHPDLLNCPNGVVDLRTGTLSAPNPDLRLTMSTGTEYRRHTHHDDLSAVLGAHDEPERRYMQTLYGYGATGRTDEDLMPVFGGAGSNGKTTELGAVRAALSDYAMAAPAELLMSNRDEHPTLIAQLRGKRLVVIEETAEDAQLRVERMKGLTGGSELRARFIAADYFSFKPTHLLVIATNHKPAVNSTDHGTRRRLRLIPFNRRYASPEKARPGDLPVDKGLRSRLERRAQREATLAWIVAGAVEWYAHGIQDTPTIAAATRTWLESEDVVLRFIRDRCCVCDPDAETTATALFSEYTDWCEGEGRRPGSAKTLGRRLEEHDLANEHQITRRKTRSANVWAGLKIGSCGGCGGYSDDSPRVLNIASAGTPSTTSTLGQKPPESSRSDETGEIVRNGHDPTKTPNPPPATGDLCRSCNNAPRGSFNDTCIDCTEGAN